MSALAAKQQLLEQQIAEQKSLMASLAAASPEGKKDVMTRLRKLGEEMTATPITTTSTTLPPSVATKKPVIQVDAHEQKERERLDKELEMHSVTGDVDGEESAEDLKAKLEKLKAEVEERPMNFVFVTHSIHNRPLVWVSRRQALNLLGVALIAAIGGVVEELGVSIEVPCEVGPLDQA